MKNYTFFENSCNLNFEGFIHDTTLYTGNCDCTHRRRIEHFLISQSEIKKRIHYKFAKRIYMNHRKLHRPKRKMRQKNVKLFYPVM